MKHTYPWIAAAALLIGAAGCAQLVGPQTLSENYALMAGAESNRPAFIDGDHSSAADSVFPSSASQSGRSGASEAYVVLPVAKTINRIKVHSDDLLGLDLLIEDPTQGWRLHGSYDGLKGPVVDLRLKGIVYTSGIKLRVRRTSKDGSAYRENTQSSGGARYVSGRTRAAARISEIEIYGPGGSSAGADVVAEGPTEDNSPSLSLKGMKDPTPSAPQAVQPSAAKAGDAPNFTLPTLDGKNLSLSDYRGRVVLINFWATWCPPCVAEMPDLQAVRDELSPRGFEVIAIALDRDGANQYQTDAVKTKVQNFVTDHDITFPVVLADSSISSAYGGVQAIPTSFVIDANGNIASKHVGMLNRRQFKAAVQQAYGGVE